MSLTELRTRLKGRRGELSALRIAVLAGGGSSEREVSLRSGRAVLDALTAKGHNAEVLQLGHDDLSLESSSAAGLPAGVAASSTSSLAHIGGSSALQAVRQADLVFMMLHGSRGENGAWQGLLELAGVPYVSAGVRGSAIAIDKIVSKRLFEQLNIPTPRWWVYKSGHKRPEIPADVQALVAKPPTEGSSVGIKMVANDSAGWAQLNELAEKYEPLLIEERIQGRELTVGVIGPSSDGIALPIVEILAGGEFYDYDSKYSGTSRYECPAKVDGEIAGRITDHALAIYREFDLGPFARVDCLLDERGQPHFLEANTIPGFTELSLLPMAARAAGIEMGELLELLMLCAIERHETQRGAA